MPGRPSDTSAARSASARLHRQPVPATLTPPCHRATAPPGQFRKLDALAVLTGPLLPAPRPADGHRQRMALRPDLEA